MINVGSDFSGVGAFEQGLRRLGIDYKTVYACDMDKYARQTYIENYGEPVYYPENVYNREIPKKPLDIYMTSPPCQSFSLAGKRKGEDDNRGVLFYNSHEFIIKNNPRYFIFENVKGLLSDASGRTFNTWLEMLGGKSVNGNPVIFPREDAAPYHIYHKVLNAKHFGVPQNRERVFIIGIRDDQDNDFSFPKPFPLTKRLKDVLETEVDEKYYLSDKMLSYLTTRSDNYNNGKINYKDQNDTASCINASSGSLDISDNIIKEGFIRQDTQASQVYSEDGTSPTLSAGTHGYAQGYVKVKSATKKGYETATEGDSINLSQPNSETRRGRVGKEVAQTLDTNCNQGVMVSKEVRTQDAKNQRKETGTNDFRGKEIEFRESDTMNCITSGLTNDHFIKTSNALTTVQKDNVVVYEGIAVHPLSKKLEFNGFKDGNSPALLATDYKAPKCIKYSNHKIRRLTPRECFRLMDFPDTFTWPVSNSQAYKQAGNSIVVNVLVEIISKLKI
jgi:DNA (cytosine-5)-methyltransferase 1